MLTFIVLGVVPGTHIQLTFYHVLIAAMVLTAAALIWSLVRRHLKSSFTVEDQLSLISL